EPRRHEGARRGPDLDGPGGAALDARLGRGDRRGGDRRGGRPHRPGAGEDRRRPRGGGGAFGGCRPRRRGGARAAPDLRGRDRTCRPARRAPEGVGHPGARGAAGGARGGGRRRGPRPRRPAGRPRGQAARRNPRRRRRGARRAPYRAGEGGTGGPRKGAVEQDDRARATHKRAHRQVPRLLPLREARRLQQDRGHGRGGEARFDLLV
ncbi:MAG: hypothetical protein AVDCRST_MAG25-3003, partial [uncultured Rubrobacteraceae bacterium]